MVRFLLSLALALSLFSPAASANLDNVMAINAGSFSAVGDFVADTAYTGGSTYVTGAAIDRANVADPAPEAVYQTCRYGNFLYSIPGLQVGVSYKVRLHFAEPVWNSAGARVFNMSLNGTAALTNFDIFAVAGGKNIALIREFTVDANNLGKIDIQFSSLVDASLVNGIEVALSVPPVPQPTPSYNLSLGADRATYTAGQKATVITSLHNLPDNQNYEFHVSATLNGNPIALTKITDSQRYAVTPALTAGTSTFVASLFLQDKNEAKALEQSITFYTAEISRLTTELGQTTNPARIAELEAEISKKQNLLATTRQHLNRVRTAVGSPVSLTLSVQ